MLKAAFFIIVKKTESHSMHPHRRVEQPQCGCTYGQPGKDQTSGRCTNQEEPHKYIQQRLQTQEPLLHCSFFETGFLCVAMAVLELTL